MYVVTLSWLHRIWLLDLLILVPLIRCLVLPLCLTANRLVTLLEGNVSDIIKELRVAGHIGQGGVHIASKQENIIHLGSEAWIERIYCILELKKRTILLPALCRPLES